MANTLVTLYTEVADRLNLDATVAANKTRLIRWANIIQNDIASRYPWSWLMTNGFIQTVTDYTTGTITGVSGSTALTGIGTSWTSSSPNMTNCYIQPANDTNWYEVSTVGSGTSITLANPLTASITSGTYVLRTTYYDLPANCYKVYDVRQTNTPTKLTPLGLYTLDTFQPDINTTSNPTGYFLFGEDPLVAVSAAKQTLIGFFPCPDAKYNIQFRYFLNQTDLAADTDIPLIPVPYTNVLLDGMEWLGNKFLNDPNEGQLKTAYEYSIQKMIESENQNGDYFPVLRSSDSSQDVSKFLPFPGNFPSLGGGNYDG